MENKTVTQQQNEELLKAILELPEAEQENVHTWSKEQLEKLKKAEETLEEIFDKAFDEGIVSDEAWRIHEIIMDMGMALDVVAVCEKKGKDVGDAYITMLKKNLK